MPEIDYKKKLNIMKKVSDIHLTEKELETLYYLKDKKRWSEIWDLSNGIKFDVSQSLESIPPITKILKGNKLIGVEEWKYNITPEGIQLIRLIENEQKKWFIKRIVDIGDWIKRYKLLFLIIGFIMVIILYLITGCKITDWFSAIDCAKSLFIGQLTWTN